MQMSPRSQTEACSSLQMPPRTRYPIFRDTGARHTINPQHGVWVSKVTTSYPGQWAGPSFDSLTTMSLTSSILLRHITQSSS
eukprot:355048-Chlamydomonas_euryale.AAC.11